VFSMIGAENEVGLIGFCFSWPRRWRQPINADALVRAQRSAKVPSAIEQARSSSVERCHKHGRGRGFNSFPRLPTTIWTRKPTFPCRKSTAHTMTRSSSLPLTTYVAIVNHELARS
jgi:hypothetical protein